MLAAAAGPAADVWFSAYLGPPARLVYLDDPTRRRISIGAVSFRVVKPCGRVVTTTDQVCGSDLARFRSMSGQSGRPVRPVRPEDFPNEPRFHAGVHQSRLAA